MISRFNYGKIVLVTFITILIWVWADTAQDINAKINNITIQAKASEDNLWLSFDGKTTAKIDVLEFRGRQAKVNSIKNDWLDGDLELKFFLNPSDVGLSEPGQSSLNLLDFIKNSDQMRNLGVTAVSCEPENLTVQVSKLTKRQLKVRCTRNKIPIVAKSIEPPTVTMLVPDDWPDERLVANVELTDNEIEHARHNPIEKKAYVTFASDLDKQAKTPIMIQMSSVNEGFKQYTITGATVVYAFSDNLQGKYSVELMNLTELSSFSISATPTAKAAFEAQPAQITLYILDGDEQSKAELRREVVYNLPTEFVRNNQIKLNEPKEIAKFRLKPIQSAPVANGGP